MAWLAWIEHGYRKKYNSLIENGTWEQVSPPKGANIITKKWCFKLKKYRFGHIMKYKAWWVAHGYQQEEGLDYVKTFAAIVKPMSYKCLFAVGVKLGYRILHLDVVTVFSYGFLGEVIFMNSLTYLP